VSRSVRVVLDEDLLGHSAAVPCGRRPSDDPLPTRSARGADPRSASHETSVPAASSTVVASLVAGRQEAGATPSRLPGRIAQLLRAGPDGRVAGHARTKL